MIRSFVCFSHRAPPLARSFTGSSRTRSDRLVFAYCVAPVALAYSAYSLLDSDGESPPAPLPQPLLITSMSLSIWTNNSPARTEKHSQTQPTNTTRTAMTTDMVEPGRPETLTPEEELKLKELWLATLKVFGVITSEHSESPSPTSSAEEDRESVSASSDTGLASEKKRSSFGRLLYRKKEEPQKKEATPVFAVADGDDKYGHARDYKAALASQTPAELRAAFWGMVKCDNPDGLLLRFLRARKWDVDKALVMVVATMKWRSSDRDVQGIMEKGEEGMKLADDEGFMKQLRLGKSYLHGLDKDGRPICYVRVRLHRQADQSEEVLEKFTVYIMETARMTLIPPVDTAAVVFDMTGFSLANMDYTPVKFMIKCFEAHYPESLGICLVHKAPWVFQGIWTIIKGWLDPVVASKIHFTKTIEDMEAFIPRSQILKELGGDDDWSYSYIEPIPGENDAMKDTVRRETLDRGRKTLVREFEELTRNWITADRQASAKIKQERNKVAKSLREGYWEIDKYTRARTIYDRMGVIGPKGGLDFSKKISNGAVMETNDDDID